jgi:hypothetical protein
MENRAMGVLVDVVTLSVAVPDPLPLIITGEPLKEQVGTGLPPVMLPHESVTLPL